MQSASFNMAEGGRGTGDAGTRAVQAQYSKLPVGGRILLLVSKVAFAPLKADVFLGTLLQPTFLHRVAFPSLSFSNPRRCAPWAAAFGFLLPGLDRWQYGCVLLQENPPQKYIYIYIYEIMYR